MNGKGIPARLGIAPPFILSLSKDEGAVGMGGIVIAPPFILSLSKDERAAGLAGGGYWDWPPFHPRGLGLAPPFIRAAWGWPPPFIRRGLGLAPPFILSLSKDVRGAAGLARR